MKRFLITLPFVLAALPAAAQSGPTETQQRFACMGDAFRLCPSSIPDRDRIIQCMYTQRASLSSGCRQVFDASYREFVSRRQMR